MSPGRRVCQECKGNGFLKTSIGKIVQCLNCWSEGEIDEKIWARDYDPIFLMSCSQSKKIDKVTWDPVKAMVRITFGQVK